MAEPTTTDPGTGKANFRESNASREEKPSLLSNVLAVVGFIIVILIVLWGLFHLATLAKPWLSSLFLRNSAPAASLEVQAPESALSGTPIRVSWKSSATGSGMYAFLYECKDGLKFQAPTPAGTVQAIPCGAAYSIPASASSITVTPVVSGSETLPASISILFLPGSSGGSQLRGSATVAVRPVPAPSGESETPRAQPAAPAAVRPAGPADLSVRIVSLSSDGAGRGTFIFDISNVGERASGSYRFQAYLPADGGYTYDSPIQPSLGPGDHVVSTLSFGPAVSGAASVVVDPMNAVNELNETNNYASQSLFAPSSSYYDAYYYPQQQYPYVYGY